MVVVLLHKAKESIELDSPLVPLPIRLLVCYLITSNRWLLNFIPICIGKGIVLLVILHSINSQSHNALFAREIGSVMYCRLLAYSLRQSNPFAMGSKDPLFGIAYHWF